MRVQFPMQKSGQWSGAKRACAGAIHAFHEPCRGGQGATRLYGHNETSSRPLIDWRGVPAVCVYPEEDGTCGAMMRKKPSAAQHVYHLKAINKGKVRCEAILKGSLHTASFVLGYQATLTQIKTTRCKMTGIIWKSLEIMLKERWERNGSEQKRIS